MRSGYDKDAQRKRILGQQSLVQKFLSPYVEEYRKIYEPFEIFMFNWCINYYVPLTQLNIKGIYDVFYEHLLCQPEKEINSLFRFLNKEYFESIFGQMKKPSRMTRKSDMLTEDRDHLNSWKNNITTEQLKRGNEILQLFNLDELYDSSGYPNPEELDKLLNR